MRYFQKYLITLFLICAGPLSVFSKLCGLWVNPDRIELRRDLPTIVFHDLDILK